MEWARRWIRRLWLFVRGNAIDRAMDDELRHHVECETAERIRSGVPPEEARAGALRDFGSMTRVREEARDARGTRTLDDLIADSRYASRVLWRNPGFTIAAVLTFALGIGAASAIFSIVYGVLLRPLPYADPDRLVAVWERNAARGLARNVVAPDNFAAWTARNHVFEDLAALVPRPETLAGSGAPERVMGAEVSPGYFRLLGVAPLLGRDFAAADANVNGSTVVILSHGFWTRRFGGDQAVIGRILPIAGMPHTIVGVMPAGFEPPKFNWLQTQDIWFPFAITPANRAWGRFLLVVARLRADVSLARAQADMTVLGERLAAEAASNAGWNVSIVPLSQQITGDVRAAFGVLLAAGALLLSIAIANVATLTMTQMRRRRHELATRRSLGASDGRLFRQLFTQSALLGLVSTVVGLLTVSPVVHLLVSLAPADTPRLDAVRVDFPVLLATTTAAIGATVLFGTIAAFRGKRDASLATTIAAGDGRASARAGGALLVAAEIAVTLALGVMATLMARSFASLRAVDLGFTPDGVVAARVSFSGAGAAAPANASASFQALLERVRALPGVQSAGLISTRPFGGPGPATAVGDPRQPGDRSIVADVRYVNADLFTTLQIPLVRGHLFDASDTAASPVRVVVSQSLAQSQWPGEDPIGRTLGLKLFGGITAHVIAVVADTHLMAPRTPVRPAAYLSDRRFPSETRDLVVRVNGDPQGIVPSLRGVVSALEPDVPLYQVETLSRLVDASLASDRFTMFLLSAFAAIALLLGGVGVFGVITSEVGRRRKEIAIRMALGASGSAVTAMMVRQALARAAIGVSTGGLLALLLAQSMRSLLFGVGPADPVLYVTIGLVVAGLAVVGAAIPTMQAVRSSPLVALREG